VDETLASRESIEWVYNRPGCKKGRSVLTRPLMSFCCLPGPRWTKGGRQHRKKGPCLMLQRKPLLHARPRSRFRPFPCTLHTQPHHLLRSLLRSLRLSLLRLRCRRLLSRLRSLSRPLLSLSPSLSLRPRSLDPSILSPRSSPRPPSRLRLSRSSCRRCPSLSGRGPARSASPSSNISSYLPPPPPPCLPPTPGCKCSFNSRSRPRP